MNKVLAYQVMRLPRSVPFSPQCTLFSSRWMPCLPSRSWTVLSRQGTMGATGEALQMLCIIWWIEVPLGIPITHTKARASHVLTMQPKRYGRLVTVPRSNQSWPSWEVLFCINLSWSVLMLQATSSRPSPPTHCIISKRLVRLRRSTITCWQSDGDNRKKESIWFYTHTNIL